MGTILTHSAQQAAACVIQTPPGQNILERHSGFAPWIAALIVLLIYVGQRVEGGTSRERRRRELTAGLVALLDEANAAAGGISVWLADETSWRATKNLGWASYRYEMATHDLREFPVHDLGIHGLAVAVLSVRKYLASAERRLQISVTREEFDPSDEATVSRDHSDLVKGQLDAQKAISAEGLLAFDANHQLVKSQKFSRRIRVFTTQLPKVLRQSWRAAE